MRVTVVRLMAGVSIVVVGASFRASEQAAPVKTTAAAPVGVVRDARSEPTPAAGAARPGPTATRPAAPRHPSAAATKLTVVRHQSAPRPVVTTAAPAPKPKPTQTSSSVTVNGAPADTPYGPVQVQVTITNGRIVRADAIDYPQGTSRDQQINGYAIPQLNQETLNAQSSQIDTVSGATYTSDAYRQSLQSALDAAHFGR